MKRGKIRVIRAIRVQKTKMMSVENNQECFVVLGELI